MNSKLSDNIKENLQFLLERSVSLPFKLTLGSIAEYYSVSLTPVRLVIDQLVSEQLLIRKSNGRLERAFIPCEDSLMTSVESPIERVDSNEQLEKDVCDFVIQRSLQNHTDYLREEATANRFNIGRTIMRQIFSRLEGKGFIQHVPRCGWKVRNLRLKDLSDYLELRELLEIKALRLARPHMKASELQILLNANKADNDPLLVSLNNELHNYWITLCDNRYIQEFFELHGDFYTTVFEFVSLEDNVKNEMAIEHRDILTNLIEQNWKKAESALIKHIRDQKRNILEHSSFTKLIHNDKT
jgi:DNA-binding GntR family transcriptional regulator